MKILKKIKLKLKKKKSNQNLMLFIRGKDMSTEFNKRGINQLPNPPIITGITMKKIIIKAWEVTIEL